MSAEPMTHSARSTQGDLTKEAVMETSIDLRPAPSRGVSPVWEAVAGRVLLPAGATSVRVIRDPGIPDQGAIELSFRVGTGAVDGTGLVPASLQATMLRDTLRTVRLATLSSDEPRAPLDVRVELLAPLRPSRVVGRGRVVGDQSGLTTIEASLRDSTGSTVATATAV